MQVDAISFQARYSIKNRKLLQQQKAKKAYEKAMANILGQSDRDYANLKSAEKVAQGQEKTPVKKTFAEGLKNFFEKGVMF